MARRSVILFFMIAKVAQSYEALLKEHRSLVMNE
jgi:hypothetical protein